MADDEPVRLANDDEFIRRFSKGQCALHAFIVGMVYSRTEADDLLQEVNLALWKKRHLYDARSDFLRWAIGFARIEISNSRKKTAKSRLLFSDETLDALSANWPGDLSYYEQRLEALSNCLRKLGRREHQYITEFYQRDVTINELAEASHTPASSVYRVISQAREALRDCVQRTLAQFNHPA